MRGFASIGRIAHPYFSVASHKHSLWEVVYYTDGEGLLTVGEHEIAFAPGVVVFQPPGVPHSESSRAGFRNYHLSVTTVPGQRGKAVVVHDNEAGDLGALFAMVYRISNTKSPGWQVALESLLAALGHCADSMAGGNRRSRWVRLLESRLIDSIPNAAFRMADAYEGIPVCRDHLCRLFRSELGMAPSEYLGSRRIAYAATLLQAGYAEALTIKAVAHMSGFSDQYYFSRMFSKVMGESPSRWVALAGSRPGTDHIDGVPTVTLGGELG